MKTNIKIDLGKGFFSIIDLDDLSTIGKYKWRSKYNKSNDTFTAVTSFRNNGKVETIIMHRLIMDAPKGMVVNHINHDTLDNRKSNLRLCNYCDSSATMKLTNKKTKGIYWRKNKGYFEVRLMRKGKIVYLGHRKTELEAGKLYNKGAKKYFGEYAELNT